MKKFWFRWMVGFICLVLSGPIGCVTEEEDKRAQPEPSRCEVDNGGCGAAEYFSCTDGVGQAPTCVALDVCEVDNGGCGAAEYFSCTDGVGKAPTCVALDACEVDNGGCGAAEDFSCTDGVGKAPTCVELDACGFNNGGCGDPAEYECIPTEDDERVCRFIGECVLEEISIEPETAVTVSKSRGVNSNALAIERRGTTGFDEDYRHASELFLRFDLSAIPETMRIDEAILQMVSYRGYATGNDGNVYVHQVDNDWSVDGLMWENRPAWLSDVPLGFWWAWYNNDEYEAVRQVNTAALADVVREASQEPKKISFNLYSIGYASEYRTLADEAAEKRPQLIVRTSRCFTTALVAKEHGGVLAEDPDSPSPGSDYPTDSGLVVKGEEFQAYLKFDLSTLPAGARIVDTSFWMTAVDGESYDADGKVFTSFVEDDSWDAQELTWATRPPEIEGYWGYWSAKYEADLPEEERLQRVSNDYFGLIPLVQQEYEGDQTLSLRLSSSGDLTRYSTRHALLENDRPRLMVTYEVP